jgi:hypothetical protein
MIAMDANEATHSPTPRRRRFYYTLRGLLIAVTVVAIATVLFGKRLRVERAISAVERIGGSVGIRSTYVGQPWKQKFVAPEVWSIDLGGTQVSSDNLKHLAVFRGAEEVKLSNTGTTSECLAHLRGLHGLTRLLLDETDVDSDGLKHLSRLRRLEVLSLSHTRITDSGLAHLSELRNLTKLSLNGTQITDDGLQHLGVPGHR